MTRSLALFALVLAAAASTAGAATQASSCTGAQLSGTFSVVRGSAGAGNISYRLVLKNVSTRTCTVTGLPQGRLLGKTGNPLPTHVKAAFPGALTAVLVTLAPGHKAYATARFSPDVPGTGEPTAGKNCTRHSRISNARRRKRSRSSPPSRNDLRLGSWSGERPRRAWAFKASCRRMKW